ncbi:MAG TPA: hypothetical protein VN112_03640 [Ensifer sp.]|nr:hypothetical protein [Ensifer sp.]
MIIEDKEGDLVLARHISADTAWAGGLSFFSGDDDFVQAGTWGYDAGKTLLAHIHNEVPREIFWTQEVIFVKKGAIKAHIYNTKREKVAERIAKEGDILILLRGGHGYDILEDGTQVLEVKNGPYVGPEKDRSRF